MGYVADAECYRDNHCRVLTPDGGQVCCSTPAEAARVAEDMNRLRAVNAELLAALCDMSWAFGEPGPSGLVRWAADNLDRSGWTQASADRMDACLAAARAAIAKASEVTP